MENIGKCNACEKRSGASRKGFYLCRPCHEERRKGSGPCIDCKKTIYMKHPNKGRCDTCKKKLRAETAIKKREEANKNKKNTISKCRACLNDFTSVHGTKTCNKCRKAGFRIRVKCLCCEKEFKTHNYSTKHCTRCAKKVRKNHKSVISQMNMGLATTLAEAKKRKRKSRKWKGKLFFDEEITQDKIDIEVEKFLKKGGQIKVAPPQLEIFTEREVLKMVNRIVGL